MTDWMTDPSLPPKPGPGNELIIEVTCADPYCRRTFQAPEGYPVHNCNWCEGLNRPCQCPVCN